MSGLTFNIITAATLLAALLAALVGSVHCVGMCGPLRLIADNSLKSSFSYQIGRLSIYLSLGAFAGKIGSFIHPLILFLFLLIFIALYFVKKNKKPLFQNMRFYLLRKGKNNSFLLGLFSGALPCGFLHGWVVVAGSTASIYNGLFFMFILWLGTLPVLEFSSRTLRNPLRKAYIIFPKVSLVLFIILLLLPIGIRTSIYFQEKKNNQALTCH